LFWYYDNFIFAAFAVHFVCRSAASELHGFYDVVQIMSQGLHVGAAFNFMARSLLCFVRLVEGDASLSPLARLVIVISRACDSSNLFAKYCDGVWRGCSLILGSWGRDMAGCLHQHCLFPGECLSWQCSFDTARIFSMLSNAFPYRDADQHWCCTLMLVAPTFFRNEWTYVPCQSAASRKRNRHLFGVVLLSIPSVMFLRLSAIAAEVAFGSHEFQSYSP
jgi:hypothetical protein